METPCLRLIHFHTFVSYNSHDWKAAERLTYLLQELGIRAWLDRDEGQQDRAPRSPSDIRGQPIPGGEKLIESQLESAISGALFLIVIVSTHTLQSVWVRKEIKIARRLDRPLYFWYIAQTGGSADVSVRRSGSVATSGLWPHNIGSLAQHYQNEPLASSDSIEFTKEISSEGMLNRLGHTITSVSQVNGVCAELNHLVELSELIVHKGHALNTESIDRYWPEYNGLCQSAKRLQKKINERFGKQVYVGREPIGNVFRLKRPFALTRIRHLEMILNNETFRTREFAKLKRQTDAK